MYGTICFILLCLTCNEQNGSLLRMNQSKTKYQSLVFTKTFTVINSTIF